MATFRRKKRHLSLEKVAVCLFSIALIMTLYSALYGNAQKVSYAITKQRLENEVLTLKEENQSLNIEIQSLTNKDRVYTIARESGLQQNQANIIAVKLGN